MRICGECNGRGKFAAYEITLGATIIKVPEQICHFCNGKGTIGATQFEGHPPVYGSIQSSQPEGAENG